MIARLLLAYALLPVLAQAALDDASAPSGHFRTQGAYFSPAPGSTVTVLADGSVLVYGFGDVVDGRRAQSDQTAALRARHRAGRSATPDPYPKLWDAAARGWRRLELPPECRSFVHSMATATLLRDGRVLIAGGVCDEPRLADDTSPRQSFTRLVLFDPRERQWVPAASLREGRIHHSATLMPDGAVVLAGGESDPALSEAGEAVLASVERYAAGEISSAPSLAVARARHTATALADGSLLVAGGFDREGRALDSVELLKDNARQWIAFPPLREARYGHTATRLRDGRVLVAGGKDRSGRPLATTEIWDPERGAWFVGPSLPNALFGHAAALLASGEVLVAGGAVVQAVERPLPWAWTWGPALAEWRPAGNAMPDDALRMSSGITLVAREDGGALVFTADTIQRWVPASSAPRTEGPLYAYDVVGTPLAGQRAMFVGREIGADDINRPVARIWDAATRRWTRAGTLAVIPGQGAALRQLPSGEVIHVTVDMEQTLRCERWEPPATWRACGSLKLEYLPRTGPEIGVLADGRAFALLGEHEAAVLASDLETWTPWRIEWNRTGLAYGAPIRGEKPLARIAENADGPWIAVDEAAARLYLRTVAATGAAMLWDPGAGRWAYVFAHREMGIDARLLPDGCALSTHPLSVFDPATGKARHLHDPGIGIAPGTAAMVVLQDGTVVMVGRSSGAKEFGAGFFQRKASCAGFASAPEDAAYIAGALAKDAAPAAAPAAAVAPAPETSAQRLRYAYGKVLEHRWLLLAVFGPLALYLLLRRTRLGRMKAPASRGFRIAIYAIVAVVMAPYVLGFALFTLASLGRDCAERGDCATREAKSPWRAMLQKVGLVEQPPCRMIGVWSSRRGGMMHRIELKEDGTYAMEQGALRTGRRGGYTGRWSVEAGRMVWRHDQAPGVRDVNPMQVHDDKRFTLTEANGQSTEYELIRPVASSACRQ